MLGCWAPKTSPGCSSPHMHTLVSSSPTQNRNNLSPNGHRWKNGAWLPRLRRKHTASSHFPSSPTASGNLLPCYKDTQKPYREVPLERNGGLLPVTSMNTAGMWGQHLGAGPANPEQAPRDCSLNQQRTASPDTPSQDHPAKPTPHPWPSETTGHNKCLFLC